MTERPLSEFLQDILESISDIESFTFYVGQGLRQDLAKLFSERLLESTVRVLAGHIQAEEEISTIVRESQAETTR